MPESQPRTNRLAKETSPYLLQHQHNPVDWHPWGTEAFEAAKQQNKPIFLSVGYSTCYWCHVMERESFENESTAGVMNEKFINIKVDREERPDVDQLYMTAVQIMTHHGGWPMSVFLLPDLRPFYGGTYFPPADHGNRPGFVSMLHGIDDAYHNRKADVEKSAGQITDILIRIAEPPAPAAAITIDKDFAARLIERSASDYDPRAGGFGAAPKFPRQTLLELLLFYNRHAPSEKRKMQILHTLDCMAHGGIRDQLGGAFHRYSTDADWLVPHFEIMLYDNALLAWIYIEAYRQTEDRRYSTVARGIMDFVLGEMTSPEGAFYTAFDAEVDAEEGQTYLWTRSEVEATLAAALGDEPNVEAQIHRFCRVYGLDEGPNFADPHHGNGRPDKSILFLAEPQGERMPALLDPELAKLRGILLTARKLRKQPLLDTKIITSWNALMIRALATAGFVLQDRKYLDAAVKATEFLWKNHRTSDDGLFRTSRDGVTKYSGFLDDYAFLAQAMLSLADSGASERWKDTARVLSQVMTRKFGDADRGGFFFSEANAVDLVVRQKVATDSPLPSGNGVAARVLLSLGQPEAAARALSVFARQLESHAEGMSAMLQAAVMYGLENPPIVVPAGGTATAAVKSPQELSHEVVSIQTEWSSPTALSVRLQIRDGFHIAAHEAGSGMRATQLSISGVDAPAVAGIDYPPGEQMRFPFSQEPILAYSGEVVIEVTFAQAPVPDSTVELAVHYQPCDEEACLPAGTKGASVKVGRAQ
jgi:uncharacterized protein YyaL (SSP411 family)